MAAQLSFDSAYRALRREQPGPVYYLTGDQELLKDELIQLIIDRTIDAVGREFNLDTRAAVDLDGESFCSLVETPPMFAERRVVVVRNIDQWRKNARVWKVVNQYLSNPSPQTVLVLVQGPGKDPDKTILKNAIHVAIGALSPTRLRRWVQVHAKASGFELTADATEHLVSSVGSDLSQLAMEIDKLAAVASDETPVDSDTVAALVGVRRGETLLDWVNAVLDRDIPRAAEMLEPVLAGAGITGVRMLMTLGPALIGVRLAVALAEQGMPPRRIETALFNAIKSARLRGFGSWKDAAVRWSAAAAKWTSREIAAATRAAYECDVALKSTALSDERGILLNLILRMSPTEETTQCVAQ
ncbi:MAG: DNA polymerase III subunit delta [Gemmatimonadales bacterium]